MYLFELVFSFFYNRSGIAGSYGNSLVAQLVKNLPAMQETWVQLLGWEGPLEKKVAAHASILAWEIPWQVTVSGVSRVGHDLATKLPLLW